MLGGELEVSTKTIQRDIDFMRDQMGLPIDYDPSGHGYYYTRKVVQFPTMKISEGELVALSVARKALAQYRGTNYEKPLRDAFEKLTAGLRDQIHFAWKEELEQSISFRAAGQSLGDLTTFDVTSQCILKSEEMEFGYRKLHSESDEARLVQPLHLSCIDNQWYLFAADRGRKGETRTFALMRMVRPRGTGEHFERTEKFSLDEHLAGSFGVFSSPDPSEVRLRFDAFAGRLIRERTWHASQRIDLLDDGGLELSMRVGVSPEVEKWILGWGEHIEVLAPLTLREQIANTARKMARAHENYLHETPRAA